MNQSRTNPVKEDVHTLPVKLKAGWAAGGLGVSVLMNGVSTLILFYMISVLKIEPALAGTLIFLAKIFDVFTDPMVGYWSDRTQSPIGRRRPFLLWGAVISAGSFAMIFTAPQFDTQWLMAAYILLALVIYTLGYTVFNVPYMAMPAEMTDSYHERTSIHGYRMAYITTGTFLASSVAPWILEQLGKTSAFAYSVIGVSGAVIIFSTMAVAFFTTANARFTLSGAAVPNIVTELKSIFSNHHFLRLIAIKFSQLIGFAAFSATMLFYLTNSLQVGFDVLLIMGFSSTVASILSIPWLVKLSRALGKRTGYFISSTCYVLFCLSWLFAQPGEPDYLFMLRGVVVGVAFTGNVVFAMSMLTDTIEYDSRQTGQYREGVYTALYSFVEKFSSAFGPLIIGTALSLAGFNKDLPPEAAQNPAVAEVLLYGIAYVPAACGIIGIFLLMGYKLNEQALGKTPAAA